MSNPGAEFNPPDFRSMSLHILNRIMPIMVLILLGSVMAVSENRFYFVGPILALFATNIFVSFFQSKAKYRKSQWVTTIRFCISFPILCIMSALSRETPYCWIFFLPHGFALAFSFLMPARAIGLLLWNIASISFLWWLNGQIPGVLPISAIILVSLIAISAAWILEQNLTLIQKLPEEDRENWGKAIGNQAIVSFLVLLVGVGLTVFIIGNELDHRREESMAKLRLQAQTGIQNLDLRLSSLRSALEALAAFFDGSKVVDRTEFEIFASRLILTHPSLHALEWVPRIRRENRKQFEKQVSEEFKTPFQIKDYAAGSTRISPDKSEYYPIRYVTPWKPNRSVWGLDVAFTPPRQACVDRAFAQNTYTICQPFRLVQDSLPKWTALAYKPVLKSDIQGLVVALIPWERLVNDAIIKPLPRAFTAGFDFLTDTGWVTMISQKPMRDAISLEEFSDVVGGTRFRLRISAPEGLVNNPLGALDVFLVMMGIATSLLLAYFLFHTRKSNLPLEIMVQDRTRELQHVVIRAEEASQAKSRFLAQMSHEIRTPLNGVLGMSEALLHSDISPKSRASVDLIKASGLNLLTILNDILDLSKIESGKMELEEKPFQLSKLVSDSLAMMRFEAESHGISLELKSDFNVPEWVMGDPLRVKQILINLLNNALKFTSKGSVALRITFAAPEKIEIKVVDSGIGIGPEKLARLFQPFEQGDSSTTRKFGGTGLGLVISLQLARLMGGEINVRSQEGVGSEFTLTLYLQPIKPPTLPVGLPAIRLRRGKKLLLAEDNPVNVRVAKALLEEYFEAIDVASNGKEAVQLLASAEYEMILMDLQMPEMDGLQAAREIRQNPKWADIPIIALTANVFSSDRKDCLDAGMQDFLEKPITKARLIQVLSPYLKVQEWE